MLNRWNHIVCDLLKLDFFELKKILSIVVMQCYMKYAFFALSTMPLRSSQVVTFITIHSFLLLSGIPLYGCITVCLFT